MLNVVLFGPPGSGKGTQSELMISRYELTHFSTGDMLRAELADETELGLRAKSIMEKGELVSDEIIIEMIRNRIDGNFVHGLCQGGMLWIGFRFHGDGKFSFSTWQTPRSSKTSL